MEVLPEIQLENISQPIESSKDKSSGSKENLPRHFVQGEVLPERSIRMLQVTSSDGNQRHIVAHLGHRRDMTLKEHIPCWHVRNNGRGLLMGKFKDYIVPKLTFRRFAMKNNVVGKGNNDPTHSLYLEQGEK